MSTPPRTIAVDFDGTICEHTFPGIGDLKEGVAEALATFRSLGFRIIIYSCRTSHYHTEIFGAGPAMERPRVKEMVAFLNHHHIPFDEVDDGTKGKPLADFYIDDNGIRFDDNWAAIASFITRKGVPWKHSN